MWRHIPGVKPPQTKRMNKEVGDDQEEEHTAKRSNVTIRRFKENWKIDEAGRPRSWLTYDPTNHTMSCSLCRKYAKDKQKQNPFVVGTTNMKLESIKDHEKSKCHIDSLIQSQPVSSTRVIKSVTAIPDPTKRKLFTMFRTVHALAKKGRPMADFEWICE